MLAWRIIGWVLFAIGIAGFLAMGGTTGLRENTLPSSIFAGMIVLGVLWTAMVGVLRATSIFRRRPRSNDEPKES